MQVDVSYVERKQFSSDIPLKVIKIKDVVSKYLIL